MKITQVLGSHIAHREMGGNGPVVVLMHGNPTSSHIWRHVMPRLKDQARVIAPDLIGMGESGKPGLGYRFADHADFLEAWIEELGLDDIVFVGYDWGGSLALDWAARHRGRTRAVALTQTFLRPMHWTEYPAAAVGLFKRMRTPGEGERMVLEENWFIDPALRATNPGISDEDLAVYAAPYPTLRSRQPLLQWPREVPVDGSPADVVARFEAFGAWMATTPDVPKLLLTTDPPGLVSTPVLQWAKDNVAALEIESLGEEIGHHVPEDAPEAIAEAVGGLLKRLG